MRFFLKTLPIFFLAISTLVFGQDFPAKSNRLVNDYAKVLSVQEQISLEQNLVAYSQESSVQIAVVIMETLNGYPIDDYAFQLGEKWGVGQAETDNGALVLVSVKERKMWIATGYGLEASLTDALSKRIIENEIKPYFKQGDYYGGLVAGTDAMILATRGEYQGNGNKGGGAKSPIKTLLPFIIIFGIIWLVKAVQVKNYAARNHLGFFAAWTLLNSAGRRHGGSWSSFSGGSGSFGGGGFGGFGGGGFGGGGAGGSW
ncbi:TPM domain-containing protein [Bacteroidota bacterium]